MNVLCVLDVLVWSCFVVDYFIPSFVFLVYIPLLDTDTVYLHFAKLQKLF